MKFLTEIKQDEDDNNINIYLRSNIKYATRSGNIFIQPPPTSIAGNAESLNDDIRLFEDDNDHAMGPVVIPQLIK